MSSSPYQLMIEQNLQEGKLPNGESIRSWMHEDLDREIELSETRDVERHMLFLYNSIKEGINRAIFNPDEVSKNITGDGLNKVIIDIIEKKKGKYPITLYSDDIKEWKESDEPIVMLENVMNDHSGNVPWIVRFSAMILIFTIIRLEKHPKELLIFIENKVPSEIKKIPIYNQYLIDAINIGGDFDTQRIKDYLQNLKELEKCYNENPAAVNVGSLLLLRIVAFATEDELSAGDTKKMIDNYTAKMIKAIEKEDNPTFHVTLGRLYAEQGEYSKARHEITEGISRYTRSSDRESRIATWSRYYDEIEAKMRLSKMFITTTQELERIKIENSDKIGQISKENINALNVLNNSHIGMIAIITTIVALIATSIPLASHLEVNDAILFIVVFGFILLVFLVLLIYFIWRINEETKNCSNKNDAGAIDK